MNARRYFQITGRYAGYDPSFMAGYAASAISNTSTTLAGVVVSLFGSRDPVLIYKLYGDFSTTTGDYPAPEWRRILIACVPEGPWVSPDLTQIDFRTKHGIGLADQRRSTLFLGLRPRSGIHKSPVVVLKSPKIGDYFTRSLPARLLPPHERISAPRMGQVVSFGRP
jgi:hypothetical protein